MLLEQGRGTVNLASTLTIGATDQPSQQSTPIRRHVSSLWPRGNAAGGQLVRLRWLAVSAAVMAVAIGDALDVFDDPGSVLGVAMALAALNAAWATGLLSGRFTAGIRTQLLVDLTALTLLLHFAGGVANPLVMLYLVHAILAAILLPRRQSYLVAAYACMAFKIVAVGEMLGWLAHHGLHLTAAAPPITASLAMNPRYVLLLIGTCGGIDGGVGVLRRRGHGGIAFARGRLTQHAPAAAHRHQQYPGWNRAVRSSRRPTGLQCGDAP